MEKPHCIADAKYIRYFLNTCDGNWHNCIYVTCRSCSHSRPCLNPGFLLHPDEHGIPAVLPLQDANLLFSVNVNAEECLYTMDVSVFFSLYHAYLKKNGLTSFSCPIIALLKLQTEQFYDW